MKNIIYTKKYYAPKVNKKEVLRYMGCVEDDEGTIALIDECLSEIRDEATYRVCYSRFQISSEGDNIDLGFASVKSHSLAVCLKECDEIVLFCATVGRSIDRLIERYNIFSPSRAVVLQAIGSERVEALCDAFCTDIAKEEEAGGRKTRPRFSPGYGDLPLELQREIFLTLDPTAKIGVSLNENLFMLPTKSVSAIIGIKKEIKDES